MMEKKKLNIGCGKKIKKGYINLDIIKLPGVDITHDLEKIPYPFPDERFEKIICHQILEHISDLGKVMKELSRITKKGGIVEVEVPYFTSIHAYEDPTHKQFFTWKTFDYYTKKHYNKISYDYKTHYFRGIRKKLIFHKGIHIWNYIIEPIINILLKIDNRIYEAEILRYIFPAWKLKIELKK